MHGLSPPLPESPLSGAAPPHSIATDSLRTPVALRDLPLILVLLAGLLLLSLPGRAAGSVAEIIDSTFLSAPEGMAVAPDGTVFVSSLGTHEVFRIDPTGSIQTYLDLLAHGGVGPQGLALDGSGNLFVTSYFNSLVFRVTPGGAISVWADGNSGACPFQGPRSVAVDPAGNLFITGELNDLVCKVTPGGQVSQVLDGAGGSWGLDFPAGLATDGAGNLYVTGFYSQNVLEVTPGGTVTQIIAWDGDGSGNDLTGPWGIASDDLGNVYVAGRASNNVFEISSNRVIRQVLDPSAGGLGGGIALDDPRAVAVDHTGNLYVASTANDLVLRVDPQGNVAVLLDASGDGTSILDAPVALGTDDQGFTYVAGDYSNNVFEVHLGNLTTDAFLTYKGRADTRSPKGPYLTLQTTDAFGAQNVKVRPPKGMGAPADIDGAGVGDPITHLVRYPISHASSGDLHPYTMGISVQNAFGSTQVYTIRESALLMPAAIDLANPVSAPAYGSHAVDYMKCYKAKLSSGLRLGDDLQRDVADDLNGLATRRYDLKRVSELCLPVQMDPGSGANVIKNPDNALLCYKVRLARTSYAQGPAGQGALPGDPGTPIVPAQARHVRIDGMYSNDAFGARRLDSRKESMLCVPSLVALP